MKRYIMILDVAKCHNCNNCFLACEDEHVGNDWSPVAAPMPRHGHYWRKIECRERGEYPLVDIQYRPTNCMMCENAPCIAAGGGAVTRREDGIVLIDPEKAKGKKELPDACPYHAIWWNEELEIPQKCTFCAHLLDQGATETRCAMSCPTGATRFGIIEEEELAERIASGELVRYKDELGTKPMVFYKNLNLFDDALICGSVILDGECCEGAKITAVNEDGEEYTARTNPYGDFRIYGAKEGNYQVKISCKDRACVVENVTVKDSAYLGEIALP